MIERILQLIQERGITANKLASDLGFDSGAVSNWKKGKAKPSTEAIIKIAQYFNVSTDYLFGLTDNPEPPKKDFTKQDELNREIATLTPEKRIQAETYIRFLKTEAEFGQELTDMLNTSGMRRQTE